MALDPALAPEDYCYLTTTGRSSGRPRTIEVWFALEGSTLYMLSGGREGADWVQNLRHDPSVSVRVGASQSSGRARVVDEPREDELARTLLAGKYATRYSGDLSSWRATALPVAVDLDPA